MVTKMVFQKLLSARFLMAVIFSVGAVIGFLNGLVTPDQFIPIVLMVVAFYFVKNREVTK